MDNDYNGCSNYHHQDYVHNSNGNWITKAMTSHVTTVKKADRLNPGIHRLRNGTSTEAGNSHSFGAGKVEAV